VFFDLVVNSKEPLGPSKVVVQITNILIVGDRTSNWMFLLCTWNIIHTFYGGASLYDHNQATVYKKAIEHYNSKKRVGARQYRYTGRRKLPMRITKVERLHSMEDINLNYVQLYPREKILALQN
jgi:hypothetical protein